MGKIIDISDKLTFDENPKLLIKGKEIEINADAVTVLKVMGIVGDGENLTPDEMLQSAALLFGAKSKKTIETFNLNFSDYITVIKESLQLAVGTGQETPGE